MPINKITLDQAITSENFYQYPKIFHPYREKNEKGDTVRLTSKYCEMRNESKILYVYLKNRFQLSIRNKFVDKNGFIYVIATNDELEDVLGCGEKKVIQAKKELQGFNLIEEVRQGLNKSNRIYVGNLNSESIVTTVIARNCQNDSSVKIKEIQGTVKMTVPEQPEMTVPEQSKGQTSNTLSSYPLISPDDDKNNKDFKKIWSSYKKVFLTSEHDAVHETDVMLSLENLFSQKGAALLNEALKRTIIQNHVVGLVRRPIPYMIMIFDKWERMKINSIEDVQYKDPYVETN